MTAIVDIVAREILDSDLGLPFENRFDIIRPHYERAVPLLDVANPFGLFQKRRWHQRDVAEGESAEGAEQGPVGLRSQPLRPFGKNGQLRVRDRPELLQIVLDVQTIVVDGILANDRVEIPAAAGHTRAGRRRSTRTRSARTMLTSSVAAAGRVRLTTT